MTSNDIYAILASKPHNSHYLNRYVKFIEWCQQNPTTEDYTENHHICPKADDLFPEYESFKEYSWNCVYLSTKQHLIAHVMLWKAFPNSSMSLALDCMLGNFNSITNSRLVNRQIPTAMRLRYLAKARKEAALKRADYVRGKSTFKDSEGNKYFLETTDPLIEELGLVGNNSGHNHSEESKQKMIAAKLPNKVVKIFKLDQKKTIKLYSQEFADHINDGWNTELTDEDREYIQSQSNQKLSNHWTNRMRYMTQDGSYHGSYLKDDPIIKELNLVPLRTQSQIDQNASRTALATEARVGTNIYNNGVEERFLDAPIDSTWVLGRLPYSEQGRKNQIEATRTACKGKKTYNNGLVNKFFSDTDIIPEGFVRGMKPRK